MAKKHVAAWYVELAQGGGSGLDTREPRRARGLICLWTRSP